ncbi:hypothetical protein [Mesorhizobium sp. LSHC422A00]|uniref:hypothetical protein n=1 Tax=unclassified Mesorhizobium TaxID=325217 RepID=UPI0012EB33D0|nr:hypothetical protein [Mesorhizobium sp. LSHC422A00]
MSIDIAKMKARQDRQRPWIALRRLSIAISALGRFGSRAPEKARNASVNANTIQPAAAPIKIFGNGGPQ